MGGVCDALRSKNRPPLAQFRLQKEIMEVAAHPNTPHSTKPICVGLTCWRWESKRTQAIVRVAQRVGVTVKLTEKINGLRREIQAEVSGGNIDQFIGEFVRHC